MAGSYCKACDRFTLYRLGNSGLQRCKCGYGSAVFATPQFKRSEIDSQIEESLRSQISSADISPLEALRAAIRKNSERQDTPDTTLQDLLKEAAARDPRHSGLVALYSHIKESDTKAESLRCPKCTHPRIKEGSVCSNCSIVYAKYNSMRIAELSAIRTQIRQRERRRLWVALVAIAVAPLVYLVFKVI